MSGWLILLLLVWFLAAFAGTAFGVLLLRAGAKDPAACPTAERQDKDIAV